MKDHLKKASFRLFDVCDSFGLHVLPKHFYTSVPDHKWLRDNGPLWSHRASLTGVEWKLDDQLRWIVQTCAPYYAEVAGLEAFRTIQASGVGSGYGPIESQVLHCFMRSGRPKKVVEVGSGVSTICMLNAIRRNRAEGDADTAIICVEPHPKKTFFEIQGITHIKEFCQEVPLSVFDQLQAGDLLFIDSSHTVKTGSEVLRLYLEILPRLRPGVFIHIHDVYLPYLYTGEVLTEYFDPQETALLLALLVGNPRLSVLSCLSALHYDHPSDLGKVLTDYRPQKRVNGLKVGDRDEGHFPSSIWLQVRDCWSAARSCESGT